MFWNPLEYYVRIFVVLYIVIKCSLNRKQIGWHNIKLFSMSDKSERKIESNF